MAIDWAKKMKEIEDAGGNLKTPAIGAAAGAFAGKPVVTTTRPAAISSATGALATGAANKQSKATYGVTTGKQNQAYVDKMNSLYGQIVGRGPFQYDLQSDMLYKQMADQYTTKGQQAMMDTMGQAAALTGGYGNSYAQGVGNQAYQQYLMALNEQVPSLYQQAYNVWQDEGDRLMQLYNFVAQHPGTVEALSPKTYTVEDDAAGVDQSYQQLAQALLKNNATQEQAPSNALLNWYYQLLNK